MRNPELGSGTKIDLNNVDRKIYPHRTVMSSDQLVVERFDSNERFIFHSRTIPSEAENTLPRP